MIGQFFGTLILASIDKVQLFWPSKIYMLETVLSHLKWDNQLDMLIYLGWW